MVTRTDDDLGTLIAEYVREAEAGRARDAAGQRYSPAELRSLRRSFAHVDAASRSIELPAVDDMDRAAVEELARQVVDDRGLSPSRRGSIVDALTSLLAYATWQRRYEPTAAAAHDTESRTPTNTMLALGAQVGVWMERIIVIAFLLTAIGLALALA